MFSSTGGCFHLDLIHLITTLLLALALDDLRQVTDGDLDREVDDGEHDGNEDVPARHATHEPECTTSLDERGGELGLAGVLESEHPEGSSEEVEADLEGGEDADEDDVGSEGADQEDGAQDTHEQQEEGKASVESSGGQTSGSRAIGRSVRSIRGEGGDESSTVREPETTEGAEDGSGEAVSENPFKDTTDDHEKTTHEDVRTVAGSTAATGASPSHEIARQRSEGQEETDESNRGRVAKGLSELALDDVGRREVELLKELRAHVDTGSSAELLESLHPVGLGVVAILLVVEFGVLGGGHCEGDARAAVLSREEK